MNQSFVGNIHITILFLSLYIVYDLTSFYIGLYVSGYLTTLNTSTIFGPIGLAISLTGQIYVSEGIVLADSPPVNANRILKIAVDGMIAMLWFSLFVFLLIL